VPELTHEDVEAAARRIAGSVRPVTVTPVLDAATVRAFAGDAAGPGPAGRVVLALEHLQHTGSFKARGAQNFLRAHREAGARPGAGVTIASGGNAGLACAWAARQLGVTATVFLPATAPAVKVARLRAYGARVRLTGTEYADALAACEEFTTSAGALASHAYDHPLIAAGAGTLVGELRERVPDLAAVVVAAGGGGLFAGVATAALHHGIGVLVVEPEHCRALNAAVTAGHPVDVPVESVAADALGARRATALALPAARHRLVRSVTVPDDRIVSARHTLWETCRLAAEHAAATALAGLGSVAWPDGGGTVAVVVCGANTDPATLAAEGPA
jgi:threonine dehydratase